MKYITENSMYLVDGNKCKRVPMYKDNPLQYDGDWFDFHTLLFDGIGEPLRIIMNGGKTLRTTSPVIEVKQ